MDKSAHQQHLDHQIGVDKGPAHRAVERRPLRADIVEAQNLVDPAENKIIRNEVFEPEVIE